MTRDELMELAAEKAVTELEWKSIEFLFQPATLLELLLRIDFEGMKSKIHDWVSDDSPSAMPHRHRAKPFAIMRRAVELEEFYRTMRDLRNQKGISPHD